MDIITTTVEYLAIQQIRVVQKKEKDHAKERKRERKRRRKVKGRTNKNCKLKEEKKEKKRNIKNSNSSDFLSRTSTQLFSSRIWKGKRRD